VTWVLWNLSSFRLEIVLVSVQDRCMVCARRTVGLEIVLDAPDGTTRYEAQVEAHFILSEIVLILTQHRCTVCDDHNIGSKIILGGPDGTPR
jgi:hypothetical protein